MSEYISVCGKCGENYKCGDKDKPNEQSSNDKKHKENN